MVLCTSLCALQARAQVTIASLMKMKPEIIGTLAYSPSSLVAYVVMPFSEATVVKTMNLENIKDPSKIYAIHLVYTKYRELDSFNQPGLNARRYEELQKLMPDAYRQKHIEWKALEQREATTREAAAKCFHGFVIYLKYEVPPELIKKEVTSIHRIIKTYKDTTVTVPLVIKYKVKKRRVETGYYLPRNDKKRTSGVKFDKPGIWMREKETFIERDSTVVKRTGGYEETRGSFDTSGFAATDEYKMLVKRKWPQNLLVVTDVTGSMSPYSTQVMLWIKGNAMLRNTGRFVFFNDGNNMPDALKKTGKTGGIYFPRINSFDTSLSTMITAMVNGQGGDLPENDMEAVLAGLARWPDTDTILLIADNKASVKDISLLKNINKPINVMVCGREDKIHAHYIEIARQTGGRVFYLDKEIADFSKFKMGERMLFKGKNYEWRNGTFYRVK